ncbi:hypothetical protein SDC9_87691 [bioreactor metagenome]|uniref:Uncharacterized protein n=1 Tax=bioreactor metagenome TaxID=1076179 RepID=A0A644ZJJ3_9ZZZZ
MFSNGNIDITGGNTLAIGGSGTISFGLQAGAGKIINILGGSGVAVAGSAATAGALNTTPLGDATHVPVLTGGAWAGKMAAWKVKTAQTITFNNPGAQNYGTTPALTATATSGLPVTFTSSTPLVATITSGGVLTFVSAGTATITAHQAGNDTYAAAPEISRTFIVNAVTPGAPTIGTVTAGDEQATVSFTAPANNGGAAITSYSVTVSPADVPPVYGVSSPIVVTGLTNGQSYTFTVTATNLAGTGPASGVSSGVTPQEQAAPTATVQAITAALQVGATLTGHYTYSDENGDLEGISTYKWYRSDDAAGLNKTAIAGATAITYVLQSADTGKYISFEVTPVAAAGIAQGTSVESVPVGAVVAAPAPSDGGGSYTPPAPVTEIKNGGSTTAANLTALVSGGKTLTVEADKGAKLVFDTDALKGIGGQTSGSIQVEMKDVSPAHQEALPGKQVFSLTVSSGSGTISNFGGAVTVSLPYELKKGESVDEVTVWHLASDGTMTEIPCTYNPETGLATFTVTHFSLYVVGVDIPWSNPFTDVTKSDWFYGAVEFVSRNQLMQSTGGTAFGPGTVVTRAMLVTILWRLEGAPTAQSGAFTDVRSGAWYADAVAWASGNGIVAGYDGKFSPESDLTREQLAAILYRYAAHKGYEMSGLADLSAYADAPSDWALEGMRWAVGQKLLQGSEAGLNPRGSADRAQAATILQRFIEGIAK